MVFTLGAMAFLSPVNAIIAFALSIAPLIMPIIFGKKLSKTNMAYMSKMATLNEKVKDFLSGFEVIKTFGIEKNIKEKFSASAKDSEKSRYKANKVNVGVGVLSATVMIASQILTYLVAGYFVIAGDITVGAVIAIAGLSSSIIGPIQQVTMSIANIKSTKEIRDNLLKSIEPKGSQERPMEADFGSGIYVDNLTLSYGMSKAEMELIKANEPKAIPAKTENPNGVALKNVSYAFKPNGKYAVVGGSGKSTLLRVLMGYYDDYIGNVHIGKAEMRDINRESLYKSLFMMHQNVFMLDDTLQNNIALYNSYSDEDYANAMSKSRLDEFVATLPEGSQTAMGEGGNTISGGERQRVAMARALIKGSEVIILGEAMANLDNETAYDIEKSLLETPELTCIFATHRYTKEILRKCDGVLVMRDGELVEIGTFDELYENKEYFYSLYNVSER